MNICVYGAASSTINPEYIRHGEELGQKMAKRGHGLVFGGGANGLMGAVARGVYAEKGKIKGVVPSFFNVDGVLFEHSDEIVYTETMRERKHILEHSSDAFIVTPGGIGTFDELFEILTLHSLKRHSKPIAMLNTLGYYDSLLAMLDKGIEGGFIGTHIKDIIFVSADTDEIIDYLEKNI